MLSLLRIPFAMTTSLPLFTRPLAPSSSLLTSEPLRTQLGRFVYNGQVTVQTTTQIVDADRVYAVPTFVNEFWTSKQRAAHSLHEVSYRACFKPQLPRFFIERLTQPGDRVYDPFMGRGTTPLEAALLGRVPAGCDVNPLSRMLVGPRLNPPSLNDVVTRLQALDLTHAQDLREDLHVFYHHETLVAICALREYLLTRAADGTLDAVDDWIRMVAVNRLTGHSPGFFSVYTMPPNQAVSLEVQKKINAEREQTPARRDVRAIIARKTRSLLADVDRRTHDALGLVAAQARLLTGAAHETPMLSDGCVDLVVTSPPFLDVVDYAGDNWLRCWFIGTDPATVNITVPRKLEQWQAAMTEVFRELFRVLRPGGHVAFEVGEVRCGTIKLEEAVLPCGVAAGLDPVLVLVHDQKFTKTANCWGVDNNFKGTNTNRIVVFRKNP